MQLRSLPLLGTLLPLLVPLAAGDNITGQVVDGGGSPVADVDIDVFDQATGDEVTVSNGSTSSGGFFDADLPGPGTYKVVFIPPTTDLWLATVENVVVSGTESMGLITLPEGAALSGRVLRPNGQPFDDLDLDLVDPSTGDAWEVPGDRTDSQGEFEIHAPLAEVELQFEPNPNDLPLVAPDMRTLLVTGDTDLGVVQMELGYWIDLDVKKPGGAPVVGADLDARDVSTGEKRHTPSDNTDGTGHVDFVVPAGTYEFEICPLLADKLVTKVLGPISVSGDTDLGSTTLQAGWYLFGNVTDPQGNTAAKVDVDAMDESTGIGVPLCRDKTDGFGDYAIVLPSGTYEIEFEPPAGHPYCPVSIHGVVVSSDTILDGVLLDCACGLVYCDSNPNNVAGIGIDTCDSSSGSISVGLTNGPPNQFVYLLVGNGNGTVSQPPGAKGDLCLVGGSCLGRYDKDVGQIDSVGAFSTDILNALSNPCAGGVNIVPGATWNFQYWHRQPMGQPATFSKAISVTFE